MIITLRESKKCFEQKPIINESNVESDNINLTDFDYDLIFGAPDKAADDEINVEDNRMVEALKHSENSTLTQDDNDFNSTSNSP